MSQSIPQTFRRDARTNTLLRNLAVMYYRGLVFVIAVPFALYQFGPAVGRHYSFDRACAYAFGSAAMLMLLSGFFTWKRVGWGKALEFGRDLSIVKNDGTTRRIPKTAIETIKVQPKSAVVFSWKEDGKAQFLIVGKEGFVADTWLELVAHAERWEGDKV